MKSQWFDVSTDDQLYSVLVCIICTNLSEWTYSVIRKKQYAIRFDRIRYFSSYYVGSTAFSSTISLVIIKLFVWSVFYDNVE